MQQFQPVHPSEFRVWPEEWRHQNGGHRAIIMRMYLREIKVCCQIKRFLNKINARNAPDLKQKQHLHRNLL